MSSSSTPGSANLSLYRVLTYCEPLSERRFTQNLKFLPKYHPIDAGLVDHLDSGIEVRLNGTKLTNSIGVSEGNPAL
jgi:hypothetical protein